MEKYAMKVVESKDMQVELPLQVQDIKYILNNETHRLTTYIADLRQELKPSDLWQNFRDIKVDGLAVPYVLCLRCRDILLVSPVTAALTMRSHQCQSQQSSHLPRDETEMADLGRSMKRVRGATAELVLEEARSCFEVSRWADVTLVSSSDSVAIKVHSLVLGAACPMLQAAMEEMALIDQDEMTVIIPDTNREDLITFANNLYNVDRTNINYSSLMHLINFENQRSQSFENPTEELSDRDSFDAVNEEFDDENDSPNYSTKDLRNIIRYEPKRIKYEEASGNGKHTKVWKSYKQILVDRKRIPFLECKVCGDIFLQSSTSSSTAIKKHAKAHSRSEGKEDSESIANFGIEEVQQLLLSEPGRIIEHENATSSSEIWKHFKLLTVDGVQVHCVKCNTCGILLPHSNASGTNGLKKHQFQHSDTREVKLSPGKKRTREVVESEKGKTWDQSSIDNIKAELEAPSQRSEDLRTEAGGGAPGVSKFAISQLIQADSDRVTFEESTTHSPVWEKFLKITLDSVEVPFVCCKYCKKVYTHDRTLGTSSLIRHQCSHQAGGDKHSRSGVLPKILVQELVNTQSARVSVKILDEKFNKKLDDVTEVFSRVMVDNKETEYITCKTCNKLYVLSANKLSLLIMKKIELHDCYIKTAPSVGGVVEPENEKDCWVIFVREPERIKLRDKVKNEPHLHHFLLDGKEVRFVHCTKCLRFFNISSLNMNEERIHRCHKVKSTDHIVKFKKKTPYQCDKCEEVFRSEHFLEIHKRKIHGEGSATVMCSHCGKEFPTERLAKKHELHVHYPELSKKFPCKDCDASFHDRSKLKLHSMKHSSIKPYVCEQCGKGFNWSASFQDHMDMHSGVKKYSCEFCQRQFTKRNTLNNHRRLHTGEKPFICPAPGCGMTFVQRTACKTHAKKRHNIEITIYARNPEVPQSQASLAQMSLSQRMEQQQIQERLREQQQQQQQHQQQQEATAVVMSTGSETVTAPHIQISRAQLAQLTGGVGQVVTVLQGPDGQFTQIRLLDHRDGVEVLGLEQR